MTVIRAGGIPHTRGEHVLGLDQQLGPEAEALVRQALDRLGRPDGRTCSEMELDEGGIIARGFVMDDDGRIAHEFGQLVTYERRIA